MSAVKENIRSHGGEYVANTSDRGAIARRIGDAAARVCMGRLGTSLHGLILTGSHARNEGSLQHRDGRWRVLGDAEFLVILRQNVRLDGVEIRRLREEIKRELYDQGIETEISLGAAGKEYLQRLRPRIFAYELCQHGKVLGGEARALEDIPQFTVDDIPLEDGWRMLSNRLIEQCEAAVGKGNQHDLCYSTVKLRLDMATSLLFFAGHYQSTYGARAEALRRLPAELVPWEGFDDFVRSVDACTQWKLQPAGCPCQGSPRKFAADALADGRRLWIWELQQLCPNSGINDEGELMLRVARSQNSAERLRGWMSAWRRCGWLSCFRNGKRWLALAKYGSPRYCVYSVVGEVAGAIESGLRDGDVNRIDVAKVSRKLPVLSGECGALSGLVAQLAWNYHNLLEGTVS